MPDTDTRLRPLQARPMNFGWTHANPLGSHAYLVPALIKVLESGASRSAKARVIDIGCGNGAITDIVRSRGFDVIGIDPSEDGVAEATRAFPELRIEHGSAYDDLAAKYGRFDFAFCLEVVEHLYSPHVLVRNMASLLRPGGSAILSTPYHSYMKNLALCVAGKWDFHHHPLVEHGHIKFWSRDTLEQLVASAGLRPTAFLRLGRIPSLAKSMMLVAQKPV